MEENGGFVNFKEKEDELRFKGRYIYGQIVEKWQKIVRVGSKCFFQQV